MQIFVACSVTRGVWVMQPALIMIHLVVNRCGCRCGCNSNKSTSSLFMATVWKLTHLFGQRKLLIVCTVRVATLANRSIAAYAEKKVTASQWPMANGQWPPHQSAMANTLIGQAAQLTYTIHRAQAANQHVRRPLMRGYFCSQSSCCCS